MAFSRQGQQRVSKVLSQPAFTAGLNDYDPVALMESDYALGMMNFFPNTRGLACRRGYRQYASGMELPVKTLISYRATDGSEQFFGCTDDGIYDLSVATVAPNKVATLTNGYVVYTHFSNAAGSYIVLVNGTDLGLIYDGVTWTEMSYVAPITQIGEIEGVDPREFSYVLSFKNRLWFIQKDSTVLWYLPTDQLGGVAKPFYVGAMLDRGGYIQSIWDWTFGDSSSLNDRLAIFSSAGQVAVYSGTDPDAAETWRIDGLFFVSSPMGPKSVTPVGGDLAVLTTAGVIPLSKAATEDTRSTLLDNSFSKYINKSLNRYLERATPGVKWGIANVPTLQALVVVIPDLDRPIQFVMNLVTGAWTMFNLPIVTIGMYKDALYFSDTSGSVCVYGSGYLDNEFPDGSGGFPVQCSVFSAFNYFDSPETNKHFKLVRPLIQSSSTPSMAWKIATDYDILPLPGAPANPPSSNLLYLWDEAIWDDAFWSSEATVYKRWLGVSGEGRCAAYVLKIASVAETSLVAIDWVYEESNSL